MVTVKTNFNEGDEANFVAGDILMGVNRGRNFRDTAILYRMNAQSNALEYALKRNAIPYKAVSYTHLDVYKRQGLETRVGLIGAAFHAVGPAGLKIAAVAA